MCFIRVGTEGRYVYFDVSIWVLRFIVRGDMVGRYLRDAV